MDYKLFKSSARQVLGTLFTRLHRYISNEMLCLLYYSIIYSRIKYGILSWGTASNSLLKKIEIRLNRILRVITNKSIYTPVECYTNP